MLQQHFHFKQKKTESATVESKIEFILLTLLVASVLAPSPVTVLTASVNLKPGAVFNGVEPF
jgi:hypothetical protein